MRRLWIIGVLLLTSVVAAAQGDIPPAPIAVDEGGVQSIVGEYFPSSPSFRSYGSQPVVFLGDISNIFVDGAFDFSTEYLNLESPQILAYTDGNIVFEPIEYEIALPAVPPGVLTDLDRDDADDPGVGVYTVNFTFNGVDDPFIDAREFIAFSSITYSPNFEDLYEINGGKVLVYAAADGQAFPSGYGDDREIFTSDDPLVSLPAGYTVVTLDPDAFTFERSREVEMDILESEGSEFQSFADLSYTEAFDAMVAMMRQEYAFTEFKNVDWDALSAQYRPLMEQAEAERNQADYKRALDSFLKEIPDGHIGSDAILGFTGDYFEDAGGGVGLSLVETEDSRFIVNFVAAGSPAQAEGIEVGAEVILIDAMPMEDALANEVMWFGPFSTDHNRRLEQIRFVTRTGIGRELMVTYQNPGAPGPETVIMEAVADEDSFFASPFDINLSGFELPVVHDVLPSGYGYVAIYSFSDDNLLTLLLWDRAMRDFINAGVPGVVIDMRLNGGGSPDISNVMLGYLFAEETFTGTSAYYFPDTDQFEFDPLYDNVIVPDDFHYDGDIVALVSPTCYSACEFFTYALTLLPGTEVVGYYPTGGLGGGIKEFEMPGNVNAQFTVGRAVGADNTIHIEGTGVEPTVYVPRTEENLFSDGDPILDAAIDLLDAPPPTVDRDVSGDASPSSKTTKQWP